MVPRHNVYPKRGATEGRPYMSPLHVYSAFQHNLCDRLKGHVGAALCGRPSVVPRHNVHPKRGGHGGPPLHVASTCVFSVPAQPERSPERSCRGGPLWPPLGGSPTQRISKEGRPRRAAPTCRPYMCIQRSSTT